MEGGDSIFDQFVVQGLRLDDVAGVERGALQGGSDPLVAGVIRDRALASQKRHCRHLGTCFAADCAGASDMLPKWEAIPES